MLIDKCYLKDIRNYEESNGNILDLFNNASISNLVVLLKIFINNLSDNDAYMILDDYFEKGNSLVDAFEEIRNALLGYEYIDVKDHDIESENEECYEDITKYKTLTEFYMHLGMQLMSLGVTYSEFWSLTTKEMYQVFNSIQQKMIIDFNREMQIAHISAGLVGGAVWGKLPKEAPQINISEQTNRDEETIINHAKYGEISLADLKSIKALERLN